MKILWLVDQVSDRQQLPDDVIIHTFVLDTGFQVDRHINGPRLLILHYQRQPVTHSCGVDRNFLVEPEPQGAVTAHRL